MIRTVLKVGMCFSLLLSGSLHADNTQTVYRDLDRSNWRVIRCDSEETQAKDQPARNAIDGNPDTIWHTQWKARAPGHPHEIVIDFGRIEDVTHITHLPRQDGSTHGRIRDYQIYLGTNLSSLALAAAGSFPGGAARNTVEVAPTKARFLRFVALSEMDQSPWTSAAEIGAVHKVDMNLSPSKLIRGRVSLSSSSAQKAIPVRVHFQTEKEDYFVNTIVAEGDSGADFQIPAPESKSANLYYETRDPSFAAAGFRSARGTSHLASDALEWKSSESADLVLLRLIRINGVLALPDGKAAEKDLSVYVDAYDVHLGPLHFSDFPSFKKGQKSAPFHIEIPEGALKRFKLKLINFSGGYLRGSLYTRRGVIPYYELSDDAYWDTGRDRLTDIVFTIVPDATVLSEEQMIEKGAERGRQIAAEILKPEYTEFEKVLRVHDYLVDNYEYFSEKLVSKYRILAPNDTHHTRIPFLNKLAVCGGFSDMAAYLLTQSAMTAAILDAHPRFDHGWATAAVRGVSYHIDVTGDEGDGTYNQLLMSDAQKVRIGMDDATRAPEYYWDLRKYGVRNRGFVFQKSDYVHKEELRSAEFIRIFGNVHLPAGETAGSQGLGVSVNSNMNCWIAPGEKSCFFAVKVRRTTAERYVLKFTPLGSYLGGYYSGSGLVDKAEAAYAIDLGGLDISPLDVVLSRKTPLISAVLPGHWKGEYYDNAKLEGSPMLVRDDGDAMLDSYWSVRSPDRLIPEDNFSARWTRTVNLPEGDYTFSAAADDGIRVYIDGRILIDEWHPQAYTKFEKRMHIPGGAHEIKIEYFERGGSAGMMFRWDKDR